MSAESPKPAVVDASVVIKWLLEEPDSPAALSQRRRWNTEGLVPCAPDFLLVELHNVLWKKVQRGEITLDAPLLEALPTFGLTLNWFPFEPLLPLAWQLACRYRISIYDALYAALATQLNACLYTADTHLAGCLGPHLSVRTLPPRHR